VLQGGGSLGAFSCGVFKALVKNNIRIDIAAGTSIGAINAAIMAGSKNDKPEEDLEDFWMELAESNFTFIPDMFTFKYDRQKKSTVLIEYPLLPSMLPSLVFQRCFSRVGTQVK
jgi:NTE family protein